ncbi:MAG: 2-hydroxyacid dehydrogenase, partial [Boseongicola sp.]|nr:2-hydroxyacid dehydrogenase [Boseongicola sp.]
MPDLLIIGDVTPPMLERLGSAFTIHRYSEISNMEGWLKEIGPQIGHILTNGHDGVPPDLMAGLENLKMISCYGVGYDAIDAAEAARRGIIVTHTPNVLNAEVASTAVLLLLACYRELLRAEAYVRSGDWAKKGNAALTRS